MNVNVSISGVAASAPARALDMVREAIATREQQLNDAHATRTITNSAQPSSAPPQSSRGR
jgi:hypothetical protein